MDKQPTLMELLVTMNKVKEFTKCDGEKTLAELFNLLMDEITTLRQQLAEQPKVDALVEALNGLLEHESNFASNKGDCNCNFKSRELSIKYENMRCPHQLARKALATYQSKNEKE